MFKYVKGLFLLRDITDAYEEEKGKSKPLFLSKRLIGVIVIFLGYLLTMATGVTLDDTVLTQITENLEKLFAGVVVLYGIVMELVGIIQMIMRKIKGGR